MLGWSSGGDPATPEATMTGSLEGAENTDVGLLRHMDLIENIEQVRGMEMLAKKLARDKERGLNNGQAHGEVHRAADLAAENVVLRKERQQRDEAIDELRREVDELRRARATHVAEAMADEAELEEQERQRRKERLAQESSEGRLRTALTRRDTTTTELRQAIRGTEALLEEARRELSVRETRERRAAYEALHNAIEGDDEDTLELAINRAMLAEVDHEDIRRGEAKLTELRSMTPEQRAAKQARELESKKKKEAFLLVKKDNPEALEQLLSSLDSHVRWQDWRDYAGRSLWRCCQDMRVTRVREYLAKKLGVQDVNAEKRKPAPLARQVSRESAQSDGAPDAVAIEEERPRRIPSQQISPAAPAVQEEQRPMEVIVSPPSHAAQQSSVASEPSLSEGCSSPSRINVYASGSPRPGYTPGDSEHAEIRASAFRAVAQDDTAALEEVLHSVDREIWSKWTNRAGKDLLTLSQERGSSLAYSMLARHLGMLKELQREAFEERESVWVFVGSEVQPRRATVLEDTPLEADEVSVEFWDGDEPAVMVEKCMVRKCG